MNVSILHIKLLMYGAIKISVFLWGNALGLFCIAWKLVLKYHNLCIVEVLVC